ncbi:hypothetical protein ACWEP3_29295, partial [Streptomyces albidoflavus]
MPVLHEDRLVEVVAGAYLGECLRGGATRAEQGTGRVARGQLEQGEDGGRVLVPLTTCGAHSEKALPLVRLILRTPARSCVVGWPTMGFSRGVTAAGSGEQKT